MRLLIHLVMLLLQDIGMTVVLHKAAVSLELVIWIFSIRLKQIVLIIDGAFMSRYLVVL